MSLEHLLIANLANKIPTKGGGSCAPSATREAFRDHLHRVAAACRAIEGNDSGDGDDCEEPLILSCLSTQEFVPKKKVVGMGGTAKMIRPHPKG